MFNAVARSQLRYDVFFSPHQCYFTSGEGSKVSHYDAVVSRTIKMHYCYYCLTPPRLTTEDGGKWST